MLEWQKRRNRCQTRRKPQPGWTPGEDFRQSMAPILGVFCAANFGLRTLGADGIIQNMKLLFRLFLLAVIALPVGAIVAVWMCFQDAPLIARRADISVGDIER